jgi:hypothetical protein
MSSNSEGEFPWAELDLAPTRGIAEIQRAYARLLKTLDLTTERDAFQNLRRAYEAALVLAAGEDDEEPGALETPPAPPPPPISAEPATKGDTVELARLRACLDEFTAHGRARDVSGAMAELERFILDRASGRAGGAAVQDRDGRSRYAGCALGRACQAFSLD